MQSVVTDRVAWSVGQSVSHTSEPCKTAEPIEMPFGLRTRVGPGNHVLDGDPDPPWEGAILRLKSIGTLCGHLCENGWTDRDAVWILDSEWPKESWARWGPDCPMRRGNFGGKGRPVCREPCRNGWTNQSAVWVVNSGGPKEGQVQSYSPSHWRHLANTTEPFVCGGDAVWCQITSATCFIFFLKQFCIIKWKITAQWDLWNLLLNQQLFRWHHNQDDTCKSLTASDCGWILVTSWEREKSIIDPMFYYQHNILLSSYWFARICLVVITILWSPYVIGRPYIFLPCSFFMVALWNRADHYIFMLWFVLSFFFFLA